MHDRKNNNSNMMWWMMIGCALPVIILLFVGKGSGFSWLTILAVIVMFGMHMFGMRHGKNEENKNDGTETKNSTDINKDHDGHKH